MDDEKPKKKARTWNLQTRITTELRRLWLYSPLRQKAILEARIPGTQKPFQHVCAECGERVTLGELRVDHIEPMVPVTGFVSWDDTIGNLFCSADNLQVLCKPCHDVKSAHEREERKVNKKRRLCGSV